MHLNIVTSWWQWHILYLYIKWERPQGLGRERGYKESFLHKQIICQHPRLKSIACSHYFGNLSNPGTTIEQIFDSHRKNQEGQYLSNFCFLELIYCKRNLFVSNWILLWTWSHFSDKCTTAMNVLMVSKCFGNFKCRTFFLKTYLWNMGLIESSQIFHPDSLCRVFNRNLLDIKEGSNEKYQRWNALLIYTNKGRYSSAEEGVTFCFHTCYISLFFSCVNKLPCREPTKEV